MLKAFVLVMLCAPAFADPAPPAPTQPIQLKLSIADGKETREYSVQLVENSCGEAGQSRNSVHDSFRLCAYNAGANTRVTVSWELKDKEREITNKSELLLTHKGTKSIDGGSAKLAVTML